MKTVALSLTRHSGNINRERNPKSKRKFVIKTLAKQIKRSEASRKKNIFTQNKVREGSNFFLWKLKERERKENYNNFKVKSKRSQRRKKIILHVDLWPENSNKNSRERIKWLNCETGSEEGKSFTPQKLKKLQPKRKKWFRENFLLVFFPEN